MSQKPIIIEPTSSIQGQKLEQNQQAENQTNAGGGRSEEMKDGVEPPSELQGSTSQNPIITEPTSSIQEQEAIQNQQTENQANAWEDLAEKMNNFIETLPPEQQSSWNKYFKPLADKMDRMWLEGKKTSERTWDAISAAFNDFKEHVKPLIKKLNYIAKDSWKKIEKGFKQMEKYCQTKANIAKQHLDSEGEKVTSWGQKMQIKAKNVIDEIGK